MNNLANLVGRLGLSSLFLLSGYAKIGAYAATQQYMESAGVPGALLPLVIFTEIGGGLAILAGAYTRFAAIALALFSVASAIFFHADFADQNQFVNFMKNIVIAGGFFVLAANGAGAFSLDAWRAKREDHAPRFLGELG